MEKRAKNVKILVVGEAASIHTARYVSMLKKAGYTVRLFSNSPNSHQDELLSNTVVYIGDDLSVPPVRDNIFKLPCLGMEITISFNIGHTLLQALKLYMRKFRKTSGAQYLARVIRKWNPDAIISLKMQNDGYVMDGAKNILGNICPAWAHFIWGTDIEFFGKDETHAMEHLPKIRSLLAHCDYIIADTYRDLKQAEKLGFKGHVLGQQIAQGGFNMNSVFSKNGRGFDERKTILIKGREGGHVGKALRILDALHEIKDELDRFDIKIMMATPDVRERAEKYTREDGRLYECLGRLGHDALMDIFSQARITISATTVDGTPGFLLETMAMGAIPVHSDMESIREWIDNGKNGLLFGVDDADGLKEAIQKGLSDKNFFESAQKINFSIIQERADENKIQAQAESMISTMLKNDKTTTIHQPDKKAASI